MHGGASPDPEPQQVCQALSCGRRYRTTQPGDVLQLELRTDICSETVLEGYPFVVGLGCAHWRPAPPGP